MKTDWLVVSTRMIFIGSMGEGTGYITSGKGCK